jgi:hypothetical protein
MIAAASASVVRPRRSNVTDPMDGVTLPVITFRASCFGRTGGDRRPDQYWLTAFGDALANSGGTVKPLRFEGALGYYRDAATRLYVRARHLEVARGIWISRNPLTSSARAGAPQDDYCRSTRLTCIDPSGLVGLKTPNCNTMQEAAIRAAFNSICNNRGLIDQLNTSCNVPCADCSVKGFAVRCFDDICSGLTIYSNPGGWPWGLSCSETGN